MDYLFHGKRTDNGEWVEGCLIMADQTYIVTHENLEHMELSVGGHLIVSAHKVDPASVGIYTGKNDADNKKIFVGALCRCAEHIHECLDDEIFEIKYNPDLGYYGEGRRIDIDAENFGLCRIVGNVSDS